MLESFFILLQNLPFGLLLAALLLESFIVSKNRREVEPAVLWLLFWSICASGLVILVTLAMFFAAGDTSRLRDGFWGLAVAAIASLAWYFKRQGRNRGLLRLAERFYGADHREAPKPKPGQHFWILGWRVLAVLSLLAGVGSLLRIKPGFSLSEFDKAKAETAEAKKTEATTPEAGNPPAKAPEAAAASTPGAIVAGEVANIAAATPPAAPDTPSASPPMTDPTKGEINEGAPAGEAPAPGAPAMADNGAMPSAPEATPAPAPAPAVTTPPPAPAETARPVSKNSAYFTKVRPILAKACIKCHGAEKKKGDLALHNPDAIRAGINGKPAIIPGDPEKSRIYACVILPPDDVDFMPSKGQPLSMTDKKTLFDWIKSGADLGDGVSIPGGGGGAFMVDAIAEGLANIDQTLLESLTREHVIIRPLSRNKRVVEVDFSHSDRAFKDLKLTDLAPMALNIYKLDLSRTKVRDEDLVALGGMKNLQSLILSKTQISDAGVAYLKGNAALEELNLYQTMVSDAGLTHLAELKSLKKVYLWMSKVTDAGVSQLAAAIPGVNVNNGAKEPMPAKTTTMAPR